MTQLVTRQGQQQLNFTNWLITNEYESGDVVFKDNNIYISNAIIPANTPFTIGTTGETWKVAITGYDMDLDPPLLIATSGTGYGRCHAWGNKIFRAGAGDVGGMGNMYAGGMAHTDCTIEFTCLDELPESWVKIHDMRSNFYGLGSNGILYVAGENDYGNLGLGVTDSNENQFQIIQQRHPAFYGPGITVLNFWATDALVNAQAYTGQCWVQVDDNGVIRLYSFGDNGWGCIGNGTLQDVQYLPYEHTMMRDKTVKNINTAFFRNTDSGRGGLTVIVTEDGEVWNTGGNNRDGELGVGYNTSNALVLTRAKFNATTFVTGAVDGIVSWHSGIATHILLDDGTVYSAGKNDYGRLGRGDVGGTNVPYYQQVLTAPNTPLTGVVKIKTGGQGVVALTSDGLVYATGENNDGWWGNGQAAFQAGNGYATVKQGDIKDFWMSHSGRGFTVAYWLKRDNTFWASGGNWFSQLGVNAAGGTNNTIALRVPLPSGEYPVQFKWIGGWFGVQGGTETLIGGGALMVSNKNKLYTWGKPYDSVSSVKNVSELKYPHRIVDFYDPQQF
jgi:alpha-tubulin suppressor-like RCC1 family protein